ncbi:MAG: NAD(P)-dependent oxidoreductase [Chloroflexota bacterium]
MPSAVLKQATEKAKTAVTPVPSTDEPAPPRILICTDVDEAACHILEQTGIVELAPNLTKQELLQKIGDYEAIIVGAHTPLTGQVIEYGHKLQAIGSTSPWLDNIGVSTARSLGVQVFNPARDTAVTIAEHTLARLLQLAARFGDNRLAGKTLGIVGFGQVGKQVARRAQAFDMRIIVNQPRLTPELALTAGVEAADLHALLQESDFVTLHVPFTQETDAIIGSDEIGMMPESAYLINSGHTDLIDEEALFAALNNGRLAGAALSQIPDAIIEPSETAVSLRQHEHVLVEKHVTKLIPPRPQTAVTVARQIAQALRQDKAEGELSLQLVPIDQVVPHEETDAKRVARLMTRLEDDGVLVNPPITTYWKGKYVILDGATRFTAFKNLGYPHIIVQVASTNRDGVALHTWYHAISDERPFAELKTELLKLNGLQLIPLDPHDIPSAFQHERAMCYFLDRDGTATLAVAAPDVSRLDLMNQVVQCYNVWGNVERTLLTNPERLRDQFPNMAAVAIFPQFQPETVFDVASDGRFVPAGLTRFVIPGRILRLHADLAKLKSDEPLNTKRAWLKNFLEEKLARSRMRYYQEPVVLLDE